MRAVKRWRYDCDYCKKSGGSKSHMAKHEEHCTNNPDRTCGVCTELLEQPSQSVNALITRLELSREAGCMPTLDELRQVCNECPACMLAVKRQHIEPNGLYDAFEDDDNDIMNFSYRSEMNFVLEQAEKVRKDNMPAVGCGTES